jgi:aldose sugar dehydrogenase
MRRLLFGTALLAFLAIFLDEVMAQIMTAAELSPQQNIPTGTPQGVMPLPKHNSNGFPLPTTIEGQPIETRAPEKIDDVPAFTGQTRAPYHATAPFNVTTLADNLDSPWSFALLPDGKILITEKRGAMLILDAQGILSKPLTGIPAVLAIGEVGLLDVALDSDFDTNHRIFFVYNEAVGDTNSNIVVARARLDERAGALTDVTVIFRAEPPLPAHALEENSGARIAIARDDSLFVTIGDRSSSPPWDMAQRLDTDLGKIIHITSDGAPGSGNPYIGKTGALPEIWSIGHRSEEGLAFDPSGQLWEDENGPRGGDKLIKVGAGKNYGWPVIVHGIDYPGEPIGDGITQKSGMEQPRYYWDPVIAPSGLAFYAGHLFPEWKNSVFVGALRGRLLDRLTLSRDKVVSEEPLLVDLHTRIRDVRVGPDGAVYVLTDGNGARLLKLTPK